MLEFKLEDEATEETEETEEKEETTDEPSAE